MNEKGFAMVLLGMLRVICSKHDKKIVIAGVYQPEDKCRLSMLIANKSTPGYLKPRTRRIIARPQGDKRESRMTDKLVQRAQNALKSPRRKNSRNTSAVTAKH